MADWSNAQRGLVSGFQVGQATGGKMSGIGSVIAKVADRLRQQREMGEETQQKMNLLGAAEALKFQYDPEAQLKAEIYKKYKEGGKLSPNIVVDETGKISTLYSPDQIAKARNTIASGEEGSLLGGATPIVDRTSAEAYLVRNLGQNWKEIAPDVENVLNQQYPLESSGEGIVPTKKTSQVNSQGKMGLGEIIGRIATSPLVPLKIPVKQTATAFSEIPKKNFKKDQYGFFVGQNVKGYTYIGNNKWQK